jgi:predicted CoA-substrate-specific enzyme activase
MIVAGVDIGAVSSKTVIMNDKGILGYSILPTGYDIPKRAEEVTILALERARLSMDDLDYIVATGYGRRSTPFADETITEITCHARGAYWAVPETRTIIDIGGQDSKAIRIDDKGNVIDFVMNDKCAAGTGRFLEVMANALEVDLEEFANLSLVAKDPCSISSICTVFAETEIVSLRAEKRKLEDIIGGVHKAISKRVAALVRHVGIENRLVFTGGVARNKGMLRSLEEELGYPIHVPETPQITGALGAAIIARERPSGNDRARVERVA